MSNDPFAPQEPTFVYFGEFVIERYFEGTWLKGERQPVPFDKEQGHTWSKQYFEYTFYPDGLNPDYTQYNTNDSKEWKLLYTTLQGALKDKSASQVLQECIDNRKSLFLQWEKKQVRSYKNNGEEKPVYGYKITAIYQTIEEMQAAKNSQPLPEGSKMDAPKVEALPKEQALGFVAALAKQIPDTADCWKDLQAKFDEMPMLANLNVSDSDVQEAARAASEVFKVEF